MNEEKKINEQELDKLAGGTGGADFEAAWAAYASTHCGVNCAVMGIREMKCEYGKNLAAEEWAASGTVSCRARIEPC